jgi:hypothetical protein
MKIYQMWFIYPDDFAGNQSVRINEARLYIPFEEDLALYLNKTEFHLPNNNLYQVWLNLAY